MRKTVKTGNQDLIKGVLWWPSIRDCFFILAISATDFTIRDDFHLAYVIPMFSSWMLAKRGRARELLALVIACIGARFIIVSVAAYYVGRETVAFPISSEFPFLPSVTQYLIPLIVFWVALAVPFAALRFFHEREINSRELLEKEKEILDIVTNHIDYPVFMKDRSRVFLYANKPLAKRLNREPSEIVGQTDEKLEIDCEDYKKSDFHALHPPPDNPDFVSRTYEANFDRSDVKNPKIRTIKVPVRSKDGEVIGLVGMCEPGTPNFVIESSAKLFDQMPYYSSLKDVDGYIRLANRAFCEKDVGVDSAKLLGMNEGRGARDYDLYEKALADKFHADDLSVIGDAMAAIAMKKDSTERHDIDPVAEGTLVKDETHFFKAQKKKGSETTVLGVFVYFHEID